jgi:uncharacterized protein YdiU (UPF0061 family)
MESLQPLFSDLPTDTDEQHKKQEWRHDPRPNIFTVLLSYDVDVCPGEQSLLARLFSVYGEPVVPALFSRCSLVYRNDAVLDWLDLDPAHVTNEDFLDAFAHFRGHSGPLLAPKGPAFLALAYHGHQFGVYNRNLGDGRAFLLGHARRLPYTKVSAASNGFRESAREGARGNVGSSPRVGELLDISTKGSGKTPYSRGHDGRLTIGGALRELCYSELLSALHCPTCRVLSVIATGEWVRRDALLMPGCVLTRVSCSVLRFGTLERLATSGEGVQHIRPLVDFLVHEHYFELEGGEGGNVYLAFYRTLCIRVARLAAHWQSICFVHGVLNTDNMLLTGETWDLGPCGFAETYDPRFTPASFDKHRRYIPPSAKHCDSITQYRAIITQQTTASSHSIMSASHSITTAPSTSISHSIAHHRYSLGNQVHACFENLQYVQAPLVRAGLVAQKEVSTHSCNTLVTLM